ncbi:HAD-IA family hydrolase [Pseudomonas sp. 10-1B]|uniref:HAD-IA family hydrolase n=1 Tax=Pseudomonas sp. 10-1B TaxID=1546029 RepID=UPI001EFF6A6E|nr:HAD-IA family hydrolase [Pseudomonas sp. 10-1B]
MGSRVLRCPPVDVLYRFRGVQFQSFVDGLCDQYPALSAETLITGFRALSIPLFEASLEPMPGAFAFVEALTIPACVASNGPRIKIETCLKSVGLYNTFEHLIVSAYEVQAWKPDPQIMLHAAGKLRLPANQCLVVEDSLSGVEAGLLAGCIVAGFGDTDFGKFADEDNFHPCPDYRALDLLVNRLIA